MNGGTGAYDIFGRVINGHDLDTSLYIVNRNSMSPDYFDDPDLFGSLFTFDIDQTKKSVVLDVAQYYDYYMLDGQVAAVSSAITPTVNEGLQLATGSSTGWLMGKHPGLFVRASRRFDSFLGTTTASQRTVSYVFRAVTYEAQAAHANGWHSLPSPLMATAIQRTTSYVFR